MPTPDRHPLGPDWGTEASSCASCAWSHLAGPGPKVWRCQASGGQRIDPRDRGCVVWEGELDCLACAACCGPAFDAVEVSPGEAVDALQAAVAVSLPTVSALPPSQAAVT